MIKIKYINAISFLFIMLLLYSCKDPNYEDKMKEGDILFQDLDCGALCDAIEAVTDGAGGREFSHCGLVVEIDGRLQVVEAIGDRVQVNDLNTFFTRSGDTSNIMNISLGRINREYSGIISRASEYARQQIGTPYDDEFLIDNGKWYCSELLYQSFKEANSGDEFFILQPMTFRDPETGEFFPAWIEYYNNLGLPIPEGMPGTNPGLISLSERLRIIELKGWK